jgi:hypothetical protein
MLGCASVACEVLIASESQRASNNTPAAAVYMTCTVCCKTQAQWEEAPQLKRCQGRQVPTSHSPGWQCIELQAQATLWLGKGGQETLTQHRPRPQGAGVGEGPCPLR